MKENFIILYLQNAVRRLIVRKKDAAKHSKTLKNYTGSGKPWSAEEAKAFDCAMLEHRKDFFVISKMVSASQAISKPKWTASRSYTLLKRIESFTSLLDEQRHIFRVSSG